MTDTKITAEEAKDATRDLDGDGVSFDTVCSYIDQSEREIAELREERDAAVERAEKKFTCCGCDRPAHAGWCREHLDAQREEREGAVERAEKAEAQLGERCPCCGATGLGCTHSDDTGLVCKWVEACERAEKAEAELVQWRDAWMSVCHGGHVPQYERATEARPEDLLHGVRQLAALYDNERVLRQRDKAKAAEMRAALAGLVRQVEIGTFVDEHGHRAQMLQPFHVARDLLASSTTGTGWNSPAEWAKLTAERDELQLRLSAQNAVSDKLDDVLHEVDTITAERDDLRARLVETQKHVTRACCDQIDLGLEIKELRAKLEAIRTWCAEHTPRKSALSDQMFVNGCQWAQANVMKIAGDLPDDIEPAEPKP